MPARCVEKKIDHMQQLGFYQTYNLSIEQCWGLVIVLICILECRNTLALLFLLFKGAALYIFK